MTITSTSLSPAAVNNSAIYSRSYIPTAKLTAEVENLSVDHPLTARTHSFAIAVIALWAVAVHTLMIAVSATAFVARSAVYLASLANKKDFLGHEASINAVLEHAVKAVKFAITVPTAVVFGAVLSPTFFVNIQNKLGLNEKAAVALPKSNFFVKAKDAVIEKAKATKEHVTNNITGYATAAVVTGLMFRYCPYFAPQDSGYLASAKFWGSNLVTGALAGAGTQFAINATRNKAVVLETASA